MILPAHDLWRHIAWCATGLTSIIRGKDTGDSEISQAQVALIVENQVFGLDIPVNNQLRMDSFECMDKTCNEESGCIHWELPTSCDMVPKIATKKQVHNQVEIHVVLECIVHVYNELTFDHGQ